MKTHDNTEGLKHLSSIWYRHHGWDMDFSGPMLRATHLKTGVEILTTYKPERTTIDSELVDCLDAIVQDLTSVGGVCYNPCMKRYRTVEEIEQALLDMRKILWNIYEDGCAPRLSPALNRMYQLVDAVLQQLGGPQTKRLNAQMKESINDKR